VRGGTGKPSQRRQIDRRRIEGGHERHTTIVNQGCTTYVVHMTSSPVTVARALYSAIEAGKHGDDLRPFFTVDATTLEHPNLIRPAGGTAKLEQMATASAAGA